jgi:quercetin dioxygenase-like cupin family protein
MSQESWPWPESLDALEAAPEHHTLLLENEQFRVLDTRIAPGETVPLHTHRWPAILEVKSWSDFIRRDAEGRVVVDSRGMNPVAPGTVVWTPALPPHTLENVGDSELRVLAVERKS